MALQPSRPRSTWDTLEAVDPPGYLGTSHIANTAKSLGAAHTPSTPDTLRAEGGLETRETLVTLDSGDTAGTHDALGIASLTRWSKGFASGCLPFLSKGKRHVHSAGMHFPR